METQKPPVRAACYCRISSDPKDKREGVDRQREDTTALCEVKGWTPVGFYIDNDRSASNGNQRPEWERLLADIEAGKIDAVAAWDQDRVNRMMEDFIRYKGLFIKRGILLATSNNGDIDLSTPSGVLTATIKTAVSEHEIAMMKIRMRRAAVQKAERGLPKWKQAFGYLPDTRRREDDDGTRKVDRHTAKLVRDAYKAVLAGSSLNDIARIFNDVGAYGLCGKPWTPSTVSLFLRKPRNAGLRDHNDEMVYGADGKPVKGTWPPLVDMSLWKSVQAKLNAPGRRPGAKTVQRHLLTGVLQCGKPGCGGYLSGMQTVDKKRVTYTCKSCRGVSIRAEHVEPLLYGIVSSRLARPDAVDLLKAEIDEAGAEAIRTELNTLYSELEKIGVERGQRLLTGQQAKIATDLINEDITKLEHRQQDQERLRVFEGLPLGKPEVAAAIARLSPDRFRAVMDVLLVATVIPVGKGGHVFNRDRVVVDPR
jgi:DNA invertase Pin-like site-specific DNA recombinase